MKVARRIVLAVISAIVIVTTAGRGHAADLTEAYALALSNDPVFQAAEFTLQATRQLRPEAFAAILPSITANASASRTFGRTRYTGLPEVDRSFDGDQWVLQLTQPVFRATSILAYTESRAAVEQAVAEFASAQQNLILRVARAYFDVVVARKNVVVEKAEVSALSEQLLTAKHSYDAGIASITDVDDTQSHLALAESRLVSAANEVDSTSAALDSIVGALPSPVHALQASLSLPSPEPQEVSLWVSRAVSDSPAVAAASAALSVAEYEVSRNRAQRLPTVDLVATYGGNYSSGNISEPSNFGTNVHDRQISLQVAMPLFEGGMIRARVAEARARELKARADVTAAQRQATLDAKQSFASVMSGLAQIKALNAAVAAGRDGVKGNRIGYGLGVRINSDVLTAQQQLYGALQELEKARYDTVFQSLKLKAATGQLTATDLYDINRLLESTPMNDAVMDANGLGP